ncbi:MAG: hypothetical protein R3F14_47870, partial [Polyangiaceae bacterium]
LHGAFGLMFRLGPFSWFMIAWSYLLPRPETWADLITFYRKKARPATVVLDRTSPLAFAFGRLLARTDGLDLLTFEPTPEGEVTPAFAAVRTETGALLTGGAAFREIAQALPGGRYLRPILTVLTLGALPLSFHLAARFRAPLARFFGLTLAAKGEPEVKEPTRLRLRLGAWRITARETFIAYLATCAALQVFVENKCFPPQLKPKMPPYMAATVAYPRLFQGWGMFAANPITDDGAITIDAITVDGRHIDPFTGEPPDLDISDARGLGLNQIVQDYMNRIRLDRNRTYRDGLKDYLLRWHELTGNPDDEIVAFDVFWVRDQCPRPGETRPYNAQRQAIMSYRKPAYRPRPGLPRLPPALKTVSADGKLPEAITERPDDKSDGAPPEEKRGSGDVGL